MKVLQAAGGHVKLAVVMQKRGVSPRGGARVIGEGGRENYGRRSMNADSVRELMQAAVGVSR